MFGADTRERAGVAEVRQATLRLRHVTVTQGRGSRAGALFIGSSGAAAIRDSLLFENRSAEGAGAVRLGAGGLWLGVNRSTFLGNRGRHGGAIAGDALDLRNVTFAHNIATSSGGAIRGKATGRTSRSRRTGGSVAAPSRRPARTPVRGFITP